MKSAFENLCKKCNMDFILDEDFNANLKVAYDEHGEKAVYEKEGKIFDNRGELYEALNRVACALFPNVLGRERWEK